MIVRQLEPGVRYRLPRRTADGCHEIGIAIAWFSRRVWDTFGGRYRYIFRECQVWNPGVTEIFLSREDIVDVEPERCM